MVKQRLPFRGEESMDNSFVWYVARVLVLNQESMAMTRDDILVASTECPPRRQQD